MNRSELMFLYDVENNNPNGDPGDENKPRYDEDTGYCLVTDVRLKRTIRDYLHQLKGEEIFIREIRDDENKVQDAKLRARDFLSVEDSKKYKDLSLKEVIEKVSSAIKKDCIDIRLFGATVPVENPAKEGKKKTNDGSIQITGPVQFKMGKTLHKVNVLHIKGTGAFASTAEKTQKTFREEFVLSYGLIQFYGIVNEKSAEYSGMTDADLEKLLDGIWNGTKNLITRSKVGQVPRLLLQIEYKKKLYHIGDLDHLIKPALEENQMHEKIRDVSEIPIEMSDLKSKLIENKDNIAKIHFAVNDRLILLENGEQKGFKDIFGSVSDLNELKF